MKEDDKKKTDFDKTGRRWNMSLHLYGFVKALLWDKTLPLWISLDVN